MIDATRHAAQVDAWLKRSGKGLSPEELLQLFETAFGALWARAMNTLGEVTLTAIAERVLHNATEKFPLLSSLEVEPTSGIQARALRVQTGSVHDPQLKEAIRFVLVEFLAVLGHLTAEILTPELHAALADVAPGKTKTEARAS